MPVLNNDVARIFNRLANLLEIESANPFRVRAYRNAARAVSSLPRGVSEMIEAGDDLSGLAGIGKDLADKIKEIVETGTLSQLEETERKMPPELSELMKIPGLGAKRVRALYKELDISSIEDLKEKGRKGAIRDLEGFGRKTEQKILEAIEEGEYHQGRFRISEAEETAKALLKYLKKVRASKTAPLPGVIAEERKR
jgi:DNA polymerase (family 10)